LRQIGVHHDGWTADEILAWEQFSLQMMLKPVIMAMPEDESGFEEECEKPPVLLSGFTRIPRNKFVTLLPLIPNPRNAKERKEAKVRRAFGPPFSMHQPIAWPVQRRFQWGMTRPQKITFGDQRLSFEMWPDRQEPKLVVGFISSASFGGSAMQRRRFNQNLSFHDRLVAWANEVREQAATLPPGPERDALLNKARQADTASHLDDSTSTMTAPNSSTRARNCRTNMPLDGKQR
jgi:hypothetical protein